MAEKKPTYIDFETGEIREFTGTDTLPSGNIPPGSSGGDVTGPASSFDGNFAVFDGTTGKLIKDGGVNYASFATSEHDHGISSVIGLQSALDGKQAAGSYAPATSGISILKGNGTGGFSGATSSDYRLPLTLVATLGSDATTAANVTPISLSGLVFNYEANSKYKIWFMGRITAAAATTGCGFQFDLSSAVTAIDVQFFHQLASTGTLSGGHSIADDASVGVSSGIPGTSTYPVTGFGLLVTGANTGTAQLRFRSETTAAITAKAGLILVVEKIG